MGFFSWKTSDTNKSISNCYSSRGALPVFVILPDNSYIYEENYGGYGVFGGQDIYALLAKWNMPDKCTGDVDHDRDVGIFLDEKDIKYPIKIAEAPAPYDSLDPSPDCDSQGYFYDDEGDDDEGWGYDGDEWEDDDDEY